MTKRSAPQARRAARHKPGVLAVDEAWDDPGLVRDWRNEDESPRRGKRLELYEDDVSLDDLDGLEF